MTVADILDSISHRVLDLTSDKDCGDELHRPELRVWAGADDDTPPHVTMSLSPLWAQPSRFVDLTPDEARTLAQHLNATADAVDGVVAAERKPEAV